MTASIRETVSSALMGQDVVFWRCRRWDILYLCCFSLCVADYSSRQVVCVCPTAFGPGLETADGADVVKEMGRVAVCFTVRKTETDVSTGLLLQSAL